MIIKTFASNKAVRVFNKQNSKKNLTSFREFERKLGEKANLTTKKRNLKQKGHKKVVTRMRVKVVVGKKFPQSLKKRNFIRYQEIFNKDCEKKKFKERVKKNLKILGTFKLKPKRRPLIDPYLLENNATFKRTGKLSRSFGLPVSKGDVMEDIRNFGKEKRSKMNHVVTIDRVKDRKVMLEDIINFMIITMNPVNTFIRRELLNEISNFSKKILKKIDTYTREKFLNEIVNFKMESLSKTKFFSRKDFMREIRAFNTSKLFKRNSLLLEIKSFKKNELKQSKSTSKSTFLDRIKVLFHFKGDGDNTLSQLQPTQTKCIRSLLRSIESFEMSSLRKTKFKMKNRRELMKSIRAGISLVPRKHLHEEICSFDRKKLKHVFTRTPYLYQDILSIIHSIPIAFIRVDDFNFGVKTKNFSQLKSQIRTFQLDQGLKRVSPMIISDLLSDIRAFKKIKLRKWNSMLREIRERKVLLKNVRKPTDWCLSHSKCMYTIETPGRVTLRESGESVSRQALRSSIRNREWKLRKIKTFASKDLRDEIVNFKKSMLKPRNEMLLQIKSWQIRDLKATYLRKNTGLYLSNDDMEKSRANRSFFSRILLLKEIESFFSQDKLVQNLFEIKSNFNRQKLLFSIISFGRKKKINNFLSVVPKSRSALLSDIRTSQNDFHMFDEVVPKCRREMLQGIRTFHKKLLKPTLTKDNYALLRDIRTHGNVPDVLDDIKKFKISQLRKTISKNRTHLFQSIRSFERHKLKRRNALLNEIRNFLPLSLNRCLQPRRSSMFQNHCNILISLKLRNFTLRRSRGYRRVRELFQKLKNFNKTFLRKTETVYRNQKTEERITLLCSIRMLFHHYEFNLVKTKDFGALLSDIRCHNKSNMKKTNTKQRRVFLKEIQSFDKSALKRRKLFKVRIPKMKLMKSMLSGHKTTPCHFNLSRDYTKRIKSSRRFDVNEKEMEEGKGEVSDSKVKVSENELMKEIIGFNRECLRKAQTLEGLGMKKMKLIMSIPPSWQIHDEMRITKTREGYGLNHLKLVCSIPPSWNILDEMRNVKTRNFQQLLQEIRNKNRKLKIKKLKEVTPMEYVLKSVEKVEIGKKVKLNKELKKEIIDFKRDRLKKTQNSEGVGRNFLKLMISIPHSRNIKDELRSVKSQTREGVGLNHEKLIMSIPSSWCSKDEMKNVKQIRVDIGFNHIKLMMSIPPSCYLYDEMRTVKRTREGYGLSHLKMILSITPSWNIYDEMRTVQTRIIQQLLQDIRSKTKLKHTTTKVKTNLNRSFLLLQIRKYKISNLRKMKVKCRIQLMKEIRNFKEFKVNPKLVSLRKIKDQRSSQDLNENVEVVMSKEDLQISREEVKKLIQSEKTIVKKESIENMDENEEVILVDDIESDSNSNEK